MAQQKQPSIKLISECFVKPKHEVEASKQPYHLSPPEIGMMSIDPIQKGLLFAINNNTPSNDANDRVNVISSLLDKLKHSLSIALVHFYPLAGRFVTEKYPEEHACIIYIDCNKGPGARLIHVTALEVTISDIVSSTDVPPIVRSFFELGDIMVNHDGHTRALLSIQVTELLDGVFIGFTMNHSVVDGTSFLHFISLLSEIFGSQEYIGQKNTLKISRPPIFNLKPWVSHDPENMVPEVIKLPHLEPKEFVVYADQGPLRERIFHFSPTSLANLKAKANQECETNNVISSFQALSALVWRSITRARNLPLDQPTTCSVLIGARSRFEPPLSDEYFGNYISGTQWICIVEELLGHNLGWVAMNLRKEIMAQDEKTILGMYQFFTKSPVVFTPGDGGKEFHGPNKVVIGGSARFDMYGPEFGLGRALAVRMGYANKVDGKVTANPGREGKGSVDLEICLRPQFMSALEADMDFMSYVS
ncbi:protein ENHANCED PSEUDOMONAS SUSCEPTIBILTY 1-like [Chenopodium quinoa]|uniref:Uncharacterized protein n=1 Tax=Chenopodium quinoa TaxID=63459 RepID=A0A803LPI7_CHEQI|nr:protein ENHANCED PSEUDOMONAS SUSCEPTIBILTY 1-like [Chenopodium quinoa]